MQGSWPCTPEESLPASQLLPAEDASRMSENKEARRLATRLHHVLESPAFLQPARGVPDQQRPPKHSTLCACFVSSPRRVDNVELTHPTLFCPTSFDEPTVHDETKVRTLPDRWLDFQNHRGLVDGIGSKYYCRFQCDRIPNLAHLRGDSKPDSSRRAQRCPTREQGRNDAHPTEGDEGQAASCSPPVPDAIQ